MMRWVARLRFFSLRLYRWNLSSTLYIYLCCFFFFQAEDGIRDDLVTGVQTCALPIYVLYIIGVTRTIDVRVVPVLGLVLHVRRRDRDPPRFLFRRLIDLIESHKMHRSEERRVGKECRFRCVVARLKKRENRQSNRVTA